VIVMGTLASGLPQSERKRVLALGVGMAMVFLIGFALIAIQLLQITGLLLAGGLLLLWVAWKMWRELHPRAATAEADGPDTAIVERPTRTKTFAQAAFQVALADLSMSLDNVLAVAGAAREHPTVLFIGLALSVTLTGLAANLIARLIARYHWIAYIGLVAILYVAVNMVIEGWHDVHPLASRFLGA
jgi:YjbE family integral membrane protein